MPEFQAGARPQTDQGTCYADKILKAEAQLDWDQDAKIISRKIRAFNPFPVCFSLLEGERVKIWECEKLDDFNSAPSSQDKPGTILEAGRQGIRVQCGSGSLLITKLQLPGAKALSAEQVLNARAQQFAPGARFDSAQTN